ncbi:MAG: hypothetical protein OEY67_06415 [Gammaproteobacteria bacterium]|nr:hypothetical protein [Gammaproteobacteria bacterium]
MNPESSIELMLPPNTLTEAVDTFRAAAKAIIAAYNASDVQMADQTPPQELVDGIEKFIGVATRLEQRQGGHERLSRDDITRLGDYALTLLSDLGEWAMDLGQNMAQQQLEHFIMATAKWIVSENAELSTLEPVVNAIATVANSLRGPKELGLLAQYMNDVIGAIPDALKLDKETGDPTWSWRILLLNRSIVATRSHNTALMEQVFDELVHHLPEEASRFFSEGMQQMDALNYPPQVREIMQRYFDRFTRHRMH